MKDDCIFNILEASVPISLGFNALKLFQSCISYLHAIRCMFDYDITCNTDATLRFTFILLEKKERRIAP